METSLFILLLVSAADLYLAGRARWAALLAALLLLTRPDGALFVAPLMADVLWRGLRAKRWPWAEAGIFLLTLAPWAIFATLYFGSPLPHSIAAKTLAYRLPEGAALVRLIQHYGTPFFEQHLLGSYWPLIGFALYLFLSLLGGLAAVRREARAWVIAIYPALYFIVFAAANPLIFRWYLAPPLPFYFLLILSGLEKLRVREMRWGRWSLGFLPVAFFLVTSLSEWTLRPDHGPTTPAPRMAWHRLELVYAEIGRDLAARANPQSVIAAGDVGALGYYSNARILDTVGLMSPEASAYYPLDPALYAMVYAIPPQLILDYQPQYVVLVEAYGRNGLLADARFLERYALQDTIPLEVFDAEDAVQVWVRR